MYRSFTPEAPDKITPPTTEIFSTGASERHSGNCRKLLTEHMGKKSISLCYCKIPKLQLT